MKTHLRFDQANRRSFRAGLFAALLIVSVFMIVFGALAAQPVYSIRDLQSQAAGGWHQVYEACGRTIAIDLDVGIPAVTAAPVLKVTKHPCLDEQTKERLRQKMAGTGLSAKHISGFDSREDDKVTWIDYQNPFVLDEKSGETMLSVIWPQRARRSYDWNQAYADNNPLTVHEAYAIALEKYGEIFPDGEGLKTQFVGLADRYYRKKDGAPLREMGAYFIRLRQVLYGIPLLACANRTFTRQYLTREYYNDFVIDAHIIGPESYALYCEQVAEAGIVTEDIPLIGFEAAKGAVEKLILSGNIRNVYSFDFAYALYDNPDDLGNTFLLVPAWVAWCEYYPAPEDESTAYAEASLYYNDTAYRPIIVNAQTGTVLDPEDETPSRGFCPDVLTWKAVSTP